jgi:hypothetical protein
MLEKKAEEAVNGSRRTYERSKSRGVLRGSKKAQQLGYLSQALQMGTCGRDEAFAVG